VQHPSGFALFDGQNWLFLGTNTDDIDYTYSIVRQLNYLLIVFCLYILGSSLKDLLLIIKNINL
jgi:hypothetical protein